MMGWRKIPIEVRLPGLVLAVGFLVSLCGAENESNSTFRWLSAINDPQKFGNFSEMSVNETCETDMEFYVNASKRDELWAVQVSDANGRYSSQFFFGNDYWLGSLTLCSELSKSKILPYSLSFHVARLKIKLSPNLMSKERLVFLGICFPSSCKSEDVAKILKHQFDSFSAEGKGHLTVVRVRSVPGNYRPLEDKKFLAFGGSILIIVFLMMAGSLAEFVINCKNDRKNRENVKKIEDDRNDVENNNEKPNRLEIKQKPNVYKMTEREIRKSEINGKGRDGKDEIVEKGRKKNSPKNLACEFLLSFSVVTNASKILNCSNASEDSLNSVHGLRFFSLAWVILVHTYLQVFAIGDNKGLRAVTEKKLIYHIVGNATYSVDSFFIISGLLVSYLHFKSVKKERREATFVETIGKFFTLILYRFVRLTPVYIVVLGMVHLSTTFLKDVSVFENPLVADLNCDKFWWRNILYVNNFFPRNEMCMLWSWYMAADTQLFVLSIILLLFAKRYFKSSVVALFALLVSSWCTTAYIAYVNQFEAKVQEPLILFDELYDKPWTRLGPYVVGICAGWFLAEKNSKLSIPALVVPIAWIVSLAGLFGLVFSIGNGFGVAESSVYAALGHTAWGMCLAWMVIACRCGHGGWINTFLSWPAFFPLSRLTFCAYLVHPVIMFFTNYVMDGPFHISNGAIFIVFLGNLISSYLLSFLLSLAFEAPFVRLLKLLISSQEKR